MDDYYVNEYADWANDVLLTKDNQGVLVEQYRYAGADFFLKVPAGKIEGNKTPEEGLLREIREETGFISSEQPIHLGELMVNPATQNKKPPRNNLSGFIRHLYKEFTG